MESHKENLTQTCPSFSISLISAFSLYLRLVTSFYSSAFLLQHSAISYTSTTKLQVCESPAKGLWFVFFFPSRLLSWGKKILC